MGGHGFSSFSRIGQIKREAEPSVTYEGENHVLIQQTAKFVADAYAKLQQGKKRVQSPLGSLSFLDDAELTPDSKIDPALLEGSGDALLQNPQALLRILQWRVVYMLSESGGSIMQKLNEMDGFTA
jgi:acyl-CoA oxidase